MISIKNLARLASFFIGFISLGQEILWVRIASFANGNTPQTFALVLSIFLLGIVLGALAGKRVCNTAISVVILRRTSIILVISAIIDFGSPAIVMAFHDQVWLTPVMALLILACATSKAALFPVVHHLGSNIDSGDTGRTISIVYFMNILGATFAPILIGFWALDHWSSQTLMKGLAVLSLFLAAFMLPRKQTSQAIITSIFGLFLLTTIDNKNYSMFNALAYKKSASDIGFLLENRQGVIHTLKNSKNGDAVFGGNVYDGRINTDVVLNSNGIDRLYLLAALHPDPKRILVIGLSGGAWTRVLSAFSGVEKIDVVEINPGYIDLIRTKPVVEGILDNPDIQIHIDDGRRWLRRYQGEPYDLIVMNTTFHWRAYITNLLSVDFMRTLHKNITPNGILAFNGTSSPDALITASSAFSHAYRWKKSNFIYASDSDFRFPEQQLAHRRLIQLCSTLLPENRYGNDVINTVVGSILEKGWIGSAEESQIAKRPLEIITDQNMLTEYRYGRRIWW